MASSYKILAERIKTGDVNAFKELYMQQFNKVKYYALQYLNSAEEAKDVAQETFFELRRRRQNIDVSLSLTSYLLTTARNKCLNILRTNLYSKKYEDYVTEKRTFLNYSALLDQSAELLLSSELEKKIKSSVDNLPPKTKEVFLLSRRDELSYAKIAEQMSISVKMVEYRMTQALRLLRTQLKEYLYVVLAIMASW